MNSVQSRRISRAVASTRSAHNNPHPHPSRSVTGIAFQRSIIAPPIRRHRDSPKNTQPVQRQMSAVCRSLKLAANISISQRSQA